MAQKQTLLSPHRSQKVKDASGSLVKFDFSSLEIDGEQLPSSILENSRSDGTLHVVSIPEGQIPSPLSSGISPGILYQLKEFLVGKREEETKIRGRRAGKGLEVWKSWKRAYDLWNNHYIEGRVDPEWVRDRWEEKQPQRDDEDSVRYNYRRGHDPEAKKSFVWTQSNLRAPHGGLIKDLRLFKKAPTAPEQDGNDLDGKFDSDIDFERVEPANTERAFLYYDAVQNSVWMPIRCGEKELRVDFDDYDPKDPEQYYDKNEMEKDGGVDCGRFPHPVRSSSTEGQYCLHDIDTSGADSVYLNKRSSRKF